MSGQPPVLQVVILRDGLLVGTEVFVPGTYVVGSGNGCDLRLDDGAVDVKHATLYFQNGKAAIQDNGAATGVFVNGHRVTACEVRSQDEVMVGPFSLKVRPLAQQKQQKGPPPEVAALLAGGADMTLTDKPAQKSPTPAQSKAAASPTMLSSRRMGGAAPKAEAAVSAKAAHSPSGKAAPHLRPVSPPSTHDDGGSTLSMDEPVEAEAPPAKDRSRPRRDKEKERARSSHEQETRAEKPPKPEKRRKPTVSVPRAPTVGDKVGTPRLFFELYWGDIRREARSFGDLKPKKPVLAAATESAMMPLWGFSLGSQPFVLAEGGQGHYRVFIPKHALVERREKGAFYPLPPEARGGGKAYVTLSVGDAVRFCEGEMSLVAYVAPQLKRPFVSPLYGAPWLVLFLLTVLLGGLVTFAVMSPKPSDNADFSQTSLPPVAVRLIAPEPKKKEEAKKLAEEIKKKAEDRKKKKEEAVVEKAPKPKKKPEPVETPPPAETKALKALSKLQAAGPAMGSILAAVDKLGNGPGSKNAKNSDFKLSGLIGKAPIANAGLGTFGLGGGGGGGFGTKGLEVLRGKGGGGIGAMGAGGIGRGTGVGGTVVRASARSVQASGSIDKEAVAKVVNSHLQEVRACYERALLKQPGLAGKVVLEWTISTTGAVSTAKTKSSTLQNAAVEGCILTGLKTWKFPQPKGGVVIVSYPFMFNSVGY